MIRPAQTLFLLAILAFSLFLACNKQYDPGPLDSNNSQGGTSVFTLSGAGSSCQEIATHNNFTAGIAATDSNTVTLSVNVTTIGTWTLTSGTVDGIKFSGSGTFTTTGVQTVLLKASGTPAAGGTFIFAVGATACSFSVTVAAAANNTAVFTLNGSPNACTTATVSGTYTVGVATTADNTVTIAASVANAGTYSITTATVNGINFSGTGQLAVGVQNIVLKASGTPTAAGTNNYTAGTNGCSFPVTVAATTDSTAAAFTLNGAPNACATATVSGTYTAGTAVGAGNTVTIAANVTKAGKYSISTATVNGITFSGSGSFSTNGAQTVTLKASGIPAAAGTNSFVAGVNGCSFPVTVVPSVSSLAEFTLDGAPNACATATVNGTYTAGTAVGAGNTVTIAATVTKAGTYSISTATVNGIAFSGSGSFAAAGTQTVTLKATGKPTAAGTSSFTAGTNGCSFSVTVAPAAGVAVFSLAGSPNACTNAVANGTYQAKTPLTSANTLTVYVNVTTPGSYIIASVLTNGISFSATGNFAAAGSNIPVTLTGNGTPTAAGTIPITVATTTNSSCTINVTVNDAPAYKSVYSCTINGVDFTFLNNAHVTLTDPFSGLPDFSTDGFRDPFNGSNVPEFQLSITKNNNTTVKPGTYNTDQSHAIDLVNGYIIAINYNAVNPDNSVTIWGTSSSTFTTNPPFTIIITGANASSVQGTFSGTLTNLFEGRTKQIPVTNGKFDLQVQ